MERRSKQNSGKGESSSSYQGGSHQASKRSYAFSQLKDLKPNKDLLEFYHKRISDFNSDLSAINGEIEKCQKIVDRNTDLQDEVDSKRNELSRWKQCVSEMENALFEQREHIVTLQAENDKLKILQAMERKKVNYLCAATGLDERELPDISEEPIPPLILNTLADKHLDPLHELPQSPQAAMQYAQSLSSQMQELTQMYRDQLEALRRNCELVQQESSVETEELQAKLKRLQLKLQKTESQLVEANGRNAKLTCSQHIKSLSSVPEPHAAKIDPPDYKTVTRPCQMLTGVGIADLKRSRMSEKQLKENLDELKHKLQQRDDIISTYEMQCAALQSEIGYIQDELLKTKMELKSAKDSMVKTVKFFRNKLQEVDQRRKLDAEGYSSEVKQLRQRFLDLQRRCQRAFVDQNLGD